MNQLDALARAIDATQAVIDGDMTDAELGRPTPCAAFDVSQLIDHILGTHQFLLGAIGGTHEPVDGTTAERHRAIGRDVVEAWATRGTDGTVDLGGNEFPADFGLSLHVLEALLHGWDLANALSRPFAPSTELVDAAWEAATTVITDGARGDGEGAPYGNEVAIEDGADSLARLVAFSGRAPIAG